MPLTHSKLPTQLPAPNIPVKTLQRILRDADRHWVGDGFPVRSLFAYPAMSAAISPFLLLDYAGPAQFPPTEKRLGVGVHPHRGFETVTIVYDGEVEHRDSSGGGGIIGPGDVQWMTAASGLVHEEFHAPAFARRGGPFEMVQLWVNLPAKDKMAPPRYQGILSQKIPVVNLLNPQGSSQNNSQNNSQSYLRVIAGEFAGAKGPAETFTDIQVWDLRLRGKEQIVLDVPEGHNTLVVVLKGAVRVEGDAEENSAEHDNVIGPAELGLFAPAGQRLCLRCEQDTTALLLSGEPINEPVVGQGPFVMNTMSEIRQAIADYQSGKMGQLA